MSDLAAGSSSAWLSGQAANQNSSRKDEHSPSNHSSRFKFSFRKKSHKSRREADDVTQRCSFITRRQCEQLEAELLQEQGLTLEQMLEHGGMCAAAAVARLQPPESLGRDASVLVCCGPGNNGAYGLVCARYLKLFGYKLTAFYPKTPATATYRQLLSQCERLDIPFLSYMPGDVKVLDRNYRLVVDALFGFTFEAPVREDLAGVLHAMTATALPVISLDLPSGWEADRPHSGQLRPDTLISLLAPKLCSSEFAGRRHYVAGRLLTPASAEKFGVSLPQFAAGEWLVRLFDTGDPAPGVSASPRLERGASCPGTDAPADCC